MSEIYQSSHTGPTVDEKIYNLLDFGVVHEMTLNPVCSDLQDGTQAVNPSYETEYDRGYYHVLGNAVFFTFHLKINITNPGVRYAHLDSIPYGSAYETAFNVYEMVKLKDAFSNEFKPAPAITVHGWGNRWLRLEDDNGKNATVWQNGWTWIGGSGFYFMSF